MLRHLRCRIRYSPENVQRAVAQVAFYTFVQNRNGNLNVPYLYEDDDEVVVNWNWLDNYWDDNNPALRFASLFFSLSSHWLEEFCFFKSCPCQPPSIRPISSILTDSARYFLLSSDFSSHKIIKKSLRVSIFLMAWRM